MTTKNTYTCEACGKVAATKLSQFYGQPYHHQTLQSKDAEFTQKENKVLKNVELH